MHNDSGMRSWIYAIIGVVALIGMYGNIARFLLGAEGTPLGLQLIGRPFDEATLFRVGQVIEDSAGRFPVPARWWA